MEDSNEVLKKVCDLRRSFDELVSRHSDDGAFGDSVKSALAAADFPSEEQLKKDFAKATDGARLLRIGIVGAVKAGKSSLLNSLFFDGKDILPKAATPMTAALTEITWGAKCTVTVDFFTDQDIEELRRRSEEYEKKFNEEKNKQLTVFENNWKNPKTRGNNRGSLLSRKSRANEAKEKGASAEAPISGNAAVSEPGAGERKKWEEKAEKYAEGQLKDNIYLSGSHEQYQKIRKASANRKTGSETFRVDSADQIAGRLQDYVGSDGQYQPFTSKVSITLNDERLRGISVVDTPGFNDPVPSRDERARLALRECDAVFILSRASQCIDDADREVISKITKRKGLQLYIVPSQSDNALMSPEVVRESGGKLDLALGIVSGTLSGDVSRKLGGINEDRVFDELIREASDRMFLSSGRCGSMARTFHERDSWDSGKKTTWDNLCRNYPDDFSEGDEETSINSLKKIANTGKILECIEKIKAHKAEIFRECLEQFGSRYEMAAKEARDNILREIEARREEIQSRDLGRIEREIKLLNESYNSLAPDIDEVFKETVSKWYDEVKQRCQEKLSDFMKDVRSDVDLLEGETTITWKTKGKWPWSSDEIHSKTVPTVKASGVKNAISDFIYKYNNDLPHFVNDQVGLVLVNKVINNVQKVWSESAASSEDSAAGFKNRVRTGIHSVIDKEYELEYNGAQFSFSSSSNRLLEDEAEKCLDQARDFVSVLNRGFMTTLREAMDDVYNKCVHCRFPAIVLEPYRKQLEEKKKCMEQPRLALENLERIRKEVEAILA
jgi:uncharacterized protein YdaU (DUF1376 family)